MEKETKDENYDYEAIRTALLNYQSQLASIWPSMMAGYESIEKATNEELVEKAENLAWDLEEFKKKGLGK